MDQEQDKSSTGKQKLWTRCCDGAEEKLHVVQAEPAGKEDRLTPSSNRNHQHQGVCEDGEVQDRRVPSKANTELLRWSCQNRMQANTVGNNECSCSTSQRAASTDTNLPFTQSTLLPDLGEMGAAP